MPCLRWATFVISIALLRLASCASVKQMSSRAAGSGSLQVAPFKVGHNAVVATLRRSPDPVTRHKIGDVIVSLGGARTKKDPKQDGSLGSIRRELLGVGPHRAQATRISILLARGLETIGASTYFCVDRSLRGIPAMIHLTVKR
jgi:hypothetical protein